MGDLLTSDTTMTVANNVIAILNDICKKFGIATDWSQQKILPYLKELMEKLASYHIALNIFAISVFFVTLIITIVVFIIGFKNCKKDKGFWYSNYSYMSEFGMTIITILGIATIILGAIAVYNAYQLFGWVYFPEMKTLEVIKQLMAANT